MIRRRFTLAGSALLFAGFVACAIDPLNPQPLPPAPPEATVGFGDSGIFSGDAKASPVNDNESSDNAGDAAAAGAHEGGLPPSANPDAGSDADAGPDGGAQDAGADADAAH